VPRVSCQLLLFLINSLDGVEVITDACGEFKTKSLIRRRETPKRYAESSRERSESNATKWKPNREILERRMRDSFLVVKEFVLVARSQLGKSIGQIIGKRMTVAERKTAFDRGALPVDD